MFGWSEWVSDRRMAVYTTSNLDSSSEEKPEEPLLVSTETPIKETSRRIPSTLSTTSPTLKQLQAVPLQFEENHFSPDTKFNVQRSFESPTVDRQQKDSLTSFPSDSGQGQGSEADTDSLTEKRDQEAWRLVRDLQAQLKVSHERENCLRQSLARRESLIADLDNRISVLQESEDKTTELSIPPGASCATLRAMLNDMDKKQRGLVNKINFLTAEVRDLMEIRQMLTDHGTKQVRYTKKLTGDVIKWKQDYVKLLESCIGAFRLDSSHGLMFSDYGKKKCKERLSELLEEARRKDPTLPSLNKPKNEECHVDSYGFKESYGNETNVMHYVCRHLHEYFSRQQSSEEQLIAQWEEIIKQPSRELSPSDLKQLCRAGIPPSFRGGVWRMLIHGELKQTILEKGPHYYNSLISEISESTIATKYRKQIALDLLRTMPNNIHFDSIDAPGIQKLQEILQAYSIHNPNVGYCQGMNFLVAVALLFLNKEDAFWCLTAILEKYLPPNYFNFGLISAQVDQLVLKDLIKTKVPKLAEHIQKMDIDISAITLNWFLALFYDSVPFPTLVRIWDVFLLEGSKSLFRFALALLKRNEEMLLLQTDTISFWKCLKSSTRLTYDADSLIKTAYEEFKPFISRAQLTALQSQHYEVLSREMKTKQRLWKTMVEEEEAMEQTEVVLRRKKDHVDRSCVQAAAFNEKGDVWICHGGKLTSQIVHVEVSSSRMMKLKIEIDDRASCIQPLNEEILLVGMMSGKISAYSIKTNELLWEIPIHGGVTTLVVAHWPSDNTNRVFAGLNSGELVVIENAGGVDPKDFIFTFPVGYTRISSLLLVEGQLWCSCGNSVCVFNTSTLDYLGQFSISNNALDLIQTMELGTRGVWIAVRGSPIIELRDKKNYSRLVLFNTSNEMYVNHREDEEGNFNVQRVTALMPDDNTVWIGTGNGEILVFEVDENPMCSESGTGLSRSLPRGSYYHSEHSEGTKDVLKEIDSSLASPIPAIDEEHGQDEETGIKIVTTKPDRYVVVCHSPIRDVFNMDLSQEVTKKFAHLRRIHSAPIMGTDLLSGEQADSQQIGLFEETTEQYSTIHREESTQEDKKVVQIVEPIVHGLDSGFGDIDAKSVKESGIYSTEIDQSRVSSASTGIHELQSTESDANSLQYPVNQLLFSTVRRESRFIEKPADDTVKYTLNPILRNKVTETPIRLFIRCSTNLGESYIISCATFFHDDDAILRWQRCHKDELIWTNKPILLFDENSQQVQLPTYMRNTLRQHEKMRRATVTNY